MKTKNLIIKDEIGTFCADGSKALALLAQSIFPAIDNDHMVVFNFEGVRNMNSSFSNALFANLVRHYGKSILSKIKITNTRENVKKEIASSISYGFKIIHEGFAA